MSNITGKIITKAALGTLALAAVAVAADGSGFAASHHVSVAGHLTFASPADNNNPGPDKSTGISA